MCNKRITGNKPLMTVTGGGSDIHVVGGACLFYRNHAGDPPEGTIYGNEAYRTNGQADLHYSWDAVNQAIKTVPMPLRVRSWRKIDVGYGYLERDKASTLVHD